jgi:hypothetical protein
MQTRKLAVLLGVLMSVGMVTAQDQAPAPDGGQMQGRHGRNMDPDAAAARLGKQLNLSADQVSQIKPILADQQQQMQALRADTSLSQEDRRAKGKAIMQDSRTKMEAVMNDQQKQQFEQVVSQQRERHGRGGQAEPH